MGVGGNGEKRNNNYGGKSKVGTKKSCGVDFGDGTGNPGGR